VFGNESIQGGQNLYILPPGELHACLHNGVFGFGIERFGEPQFARQRGPGCTDAQAQFGVSVNFVSQVRDGADGIKVGNLPFNDQREFHFERFTVAPEFSRV